MSALRLVRCQGAPRDLGLDQGRAAAAAIRDAAARVQGPGALSRWIAERWPAPAIARVRRDTLRHFPHMAERALGLARGAGIGDAAAAALLAPALQGGDGAALALAGAAGGARLVRSFAVPRGEGHPLWLRESRPDNDYASLEAVLPWRVSALAGVNAHGLAATATALPPLDDGDCAAPAALLVQDCLQRFRSLDAALEWCERRPAGGRATLLLADAEGRVARVEIDGRERRVTRGEGGALAGLGPAPDAEALARALADLPAGAPASALAKAAQAAAPRPVAVVVVDPAQRRLHLASPDGALDDLGLELPPA